MGFLFKRLQEIGKALMLPIAVLPAAALLLRLGATDVLDIPFIAKGGGAVFDNLPLIFSIGISVGIAKDGSGAAGLAGGIGYLVLVGAMSAIDATLNMGVLAGIISGIEAGCLYNRFHNIRLPEFLGFFGGSRFVPIATALSSIALALVFGNVWGTCQSVIQGIGEWIIGAGAVGTFVYGVLNRLLIPVGLHHILNSFIWFVFGEYTTPAGVVATGDLNRFFAGDPHAGMFMAGFFIMMMFGMPAVALAMYYAAPAAKRPEIAGMLASVAFTSFLTGITEPVEFMFMFISPVLFGIHAVLTGLALAVAYSFGILHGFGFSAGFIDYIMNYGLATKPLYILPLGLVFGAVYYAVFSWAIRHYDLPTLGRYEEEKMAAAAEETRTAPAEETAESGRARQVAAALGGFENLLVIGNCATRLRLEVADPELVDEGALKALGVRGVFRAGKNVQVVIGTQVEFLAGEMKRLKNI
ncbi:MAG: PTS sugar transporter [Selenomonas ruminantium]|nr:PTS sugar transporter [Selenomonas ruminantium]